MLETLEIFSAGATQAIVERLVQRCQLESTGVINGSYGAVHWLKSRILDGESVDVIVLTDTLIDELIQENLVVPGSRVDLGTVGTGVAVRADMPLPAVASLQMLRATMLASEKIVCPDPATATAGKVLVKVLEQLGISDQMRSRLEYCANGYEAMAQLARGTGLREIGVTQTTEIIANRDVAMAGPLPDELQSIAIYSAGLAMHSKYPEGAREFIRRLTGERDALLAAGFGECSNGQMNGH